MKLVGDSDQANIFSINCTGEGIPRNNRHHPGMRCVNCHLLYKGKRDNLREMIMRRGPLFKEAAKTLLVANLTDDENNVMRRFVRTKAADLNPNGVILKVKVKNLLSFYIECKVCFLYILMFVLHVCFILIFADNCFVTFARKFLHAMRGQARQLAMLLTQLS